MDRSEFFRHLADHGDNAYIKKQYVNGYLIYKFRDNAFYLLVDQSVDQAADLAISIGAILEKLDQFTIYRPFEKSIKLYVDLHDKRDWEESRNWGPDDCPRCGTDLKYFLNIASASTNMTNKDQILIELTAKEIV